MPLLKTCSYFTLALLQLKALLIFVALFSKLHLTLKSFPVTPFDRCSNKFFPSIIQLPNSIYKSGKFILNISSVIRHNELTVFLNAILQNLGAVIFTWSLSYSLDVSPTSFSVTSSCSSLNLIHFSWSPLTLCSSLLAWSQLQTHISFPRASDVFACSFLF